MADVTMTAANIAAVTTGAYPTTINRSYNAGASTTAGQVVYLDSATSSWKLAVDTTAAASGSAGLGLALHGSLSGQPLAVAVLGDVTVSAVLTAGVSYMVSDNAGGLRPQSDQSSGDYISQVGIATTTSNLRVGPVVLGTAAP